MTQPAIKWDSFEYDAAYEERVDIAAAPQKKTLRQFALPRRTPSKSTDQTVEPVFAELPENEPFTDEDALAIGLRLLYSGRGRSQNEADIGSDL